MNKEVYEVPSVEVVSFEVEGVIAVSTNYDMPLPSPELED